MMQVDLAKALDAQTTEPQRGDRAASEGKFPGVLKSTLSGAPRAEGSAGRGPGKPNEKSVTAENSKPPSEGSASDERAAEAAAESGAVGATAGPVDPSRQSTQAEASEEAEGRLTDLANQARSSAEEEGSAAVAEDEFVDAEIASEIDAQLESAATEPAADGDEVAAAAPNAGVAEGSREMNEELATNARDAAQEDSERRDGEARDRAREDREASRAAEERRELESAGFGRSESERAEDE